MRSSALTPEPATRSNLRSRENKKTHPVGDSSHDYRSLRSKKPRAKAREISEWGQIAQQNRRAENTSFACLTRATPFAANGVTVISRGRARSPNRRPPDSMQNRTESISRQLNQLGQEGWIFKQLSERMSGHQRILMVERESH